MRIRNRSTHYSSAFLPSPPPPNAYNINLPKLALPDPSPATPAASGGTSAGAAEGLAVSKGGCQTRESSRGTHPPAQIGRFLARPRHGGKDARTPSLGSSVRDGDGGKVVVSRPFAMEVRLTIIFFFLSFFCCAGPQYSSWVFFLFFFFDCLAKSISSIVGRFCWYPVQSFV